MELLHERCAALDIGKKDLKACVRTPSPKGKRSRRQEIRTFATTTNALLELRDWLVGERVSLVVMEAAGITRLRTPRRVLSPAHSPRVFFRSDELPRVADVVCL